MQREERTSGRASWRKCTDVQARVTSEEDVLTDVAVERSRGRECLHWSWSHSQCVLRVEKGVGEE